MLCGKIGLKSAELLGLDEVFNFVELTDDGTVLLVFLVEHLRVLEVVDEAVKALESCVGEVADLNGSVRTFSERNLAQRRLWKWE